MEPQERIGIAELTKLAFSGVDISPLRSELHRQVAGPDPAPGFMMDLSAIDQLSGNAETGLRWQDEALKSCRMYRTHRDAACGTTLLVYATPANIGANTPVEFLLEGSRIQTVIFYPDPDPDASTEVSLPPHDVAFCAAPTDGGDAREFFSRVRQIAARSLAPVVNLPDRTIHLERHLLEHQLAGAPGVTVPKTLRLSRRMLEELCQSASVTGGHDPDLPWPVLIRPVGSHAGAGLERVVSRSELAGYLTRQSDAAFNVSEFIDYSSVADSLHRKYRIIFVDGQPFPCHMAIADQWDVWYLNAGMHLSESKRQEEEEFMAAFPDDFARKHETALKAVAFSIGLDYFGIDCAEDKEGNLLVFEADNALIVHDMDPETVFPYKSAHMQRIFAAFQEMLARKALPDAERSLRQRRA